MDPTFKGLSTPVPTKTRPAGPNIKLAVIIALVFIGLVTIVGVIFSNNSSGNRTLSQQLVYRLEALDTLTANAQATIKDENLAKTNAEVSLIVSGDVATIKQLVGTVKVDKKLAALKTAEADAQTTTTLKDAQLNGTYDTTYRTVLGQKLQNAYALAKEVQDASSSKKLDAALQSLQNNLSTYYQQLNL